MGDELDPLCLHGVGETEGFVTAYATGHGRPRLAGLRTWNAGGGNDGWYCSSGKACDDNSDDVGYLDTVLEDLESWLEIDTSRVYVTGLSNGAAMSHRLACERADTYAAIVAVAGSNQFATSAPCEPERPVPVMQIHGDAEPCWRFATSDTACLESEGRRLGARDSVQTWVGANRCESSAVGPVIDEAPDDTSVQSTTWTGCSDGVEVVLLTVIGGGHTWPSGDPSLGRRVGAISGEIDSATVWEFLSRWSL
jgi:polyhydroxybutyrate depolymerase